MQTDFSLSNADKIERCKIVLHRMRERGWPIRQGLWVGDDGVMRVGRSGDLITMLDDIKIPVRAA